MLLKLAVAPLIVLVEMVLVDRAGVKVFRVAATVSV